VKIYKEIYDIRSKIVHNSKASDCNIELVEKVRHYVRESIKKMLQLGGKKNELEIQQEGNSRTGKNQK